MSTLNIVNKSPFEKHSLDQCISRISNGDGLLLIEDAVVAAVSGTAMQKKLADTAKSSPLYVLQPDLEARGFEAGNLIEGCKAVDYKGFVSLVTEHDRVHSWL